MIAKIEITVAPAGILLEIIEGNRITNEIDIIDANYPVSRRRPIICSDPSTRAREGELKIKCYKVSKRKNAYTSVYLINA